ncbi:MAG: GNAT family N-acetyltransferase [Marinoscillum sp.]|uniref:GNAT family N-acetyltransferase n=1 Tax=Marinoscillum sp. TaxID=2024838 RepID=UPI0032FDCE83
MNYAFRDFDESQFIKLHQAFIGAFSEYFVTFQPPLEQFRNRIFNKLHLLPSLSLMAWHKDEMVGFMLHTVNVYQGKVTAYNGGTGVIPSHQRSHIATQLYEILLGRMRDQGTITRVLLEVVEQNTKAARFYESLGFQFTRVLRCFSLQGELPKISPDIEVKKSDLLKTEYLTHLSFQPSFLDSTSQLPHNLANEIILEARIGESLAGHLVFQPQNGRISRVAVHKDFRQQGVASALIQNALMRSGDPKLTVMNIPEDEHPTIEALKAMGFHNELNQFELELII